MTWNVGNFLPKSDMRQDIINLADIYRIPWAKLPASWEGSRKNQDNRENFRRFSRIFNTVIIPALLLCFMLIITVLSYIASDAWLTSNIIAVIVSATTITAITVRNNLYILQLDDREVVRNYSYYNVYLLTAFAIFLTLGVIVPIVIPIAQISTIAAIIISGISLLATAGAGMLLYYYNLTRPLQLWAANRLTITEAENTLSNTQMIQALTRIIRDQNHSDISIGLHKIYSALGISTELIAPEDVISIRQVVQNPWHILFAVLPRGVTIISALINLLIGIHVSGIRSVLEKIIVDIFS